MILETDDSFNSREANLSRYPFSRTFIAYDPVNMSLDDWVSRVIEARQPLIEEIESKTRSNFEITTVGPIYLNNTSFELVDIEGFTRYDATSGIILCGYEMDSEATAYIDDIVRMLESTGSLPKLSHLDDSLPISSKAVRKTIESIVSIGVYFSAVQLPEQSRSAGRGHPSSDGLEVFREFVNNLPDLYNEGNQ